MSIVGNAKTEPANDTAIARAANILRRGGLIGLPTETVYGLAADAANDRSVAAIFAAKRRPRFNPLIVHVRDIAHARTLAHFSATATSVANAFWPGPLTLVLLRRADAPVSLLASAGLDTVALRAPAHPVARRLLDESRLAIAAPSANRSGEVSPTSAAHVAESLGAELDLILDAGPTTLGVESTIVGFDDTGVLLLRPGALPRESIEAHVGPLREPAGETITSPGRLRSHYATRTPLRLEAHDVGPDDAVLAFGADVPTHARVMRNLSPSGDLREAAANLFAMMRELDAAGCARIAVMRVPPHGLGEAINDRLRRAAAPRDV
jgi:L-threonylcarbamoyladenylate synthase